MYSRHEIKIYLHMVIVYLTKRFSTQLTEEKHCKYSLENDQWIILRLIQFYDHGNIHNWPSYDNLNYQHIWSLLLVIIWIFLSIYSSLIVLLELYPCPNDMRILGRWCSITCTDAKETLDSVPIWLITLRFNCYRCPIPGVFRFNPPLYSSRTSPSASAFTAASLVPR